MDPIDFLALFAGGLNAFAFWRYNKDVFVGGTRPNAATWFLWSLVTLVNTTSYYGMKVKWATLVVMVSDTTLCIATFTFLLFAGKFGRLNRGNWIVVWLSVGAVVLWKATSARDGNMMVQIPMILSFLPILNDARKGKTIEDPWVWVLFTSSFIINFVVVCFTWLHRAEFVYPTVATVMHAALVYYAFRGKRIYAQSATDI